MTDKKNPKWVPQLLACLLYTSRVKSGEDLIKRYKIQMDLYKEALQRLTGMPVKACYIYSFRLHDAIIID